MSRKLRWALIVVVVGLSLYSMLPLNKKVNLGLDLQGGMHVVLGVGTDAAVSAKMDNVVYQMRQELQKSKISFKYIQKELPYSMNVGFDNPDDAKKAGDIAKMLGLKQDRLNEDKATYVFTSAELDNIKNSAVMQSLEVIRRRVDGFGVAEPLIQRQGENNILVQLPGITDPDRAIQLIGQTAQLKFYIVNEQVPVESALKNIVPFDSMILYQTVDDKATGRAISKIPYVVKRNAIMTGDSIIDARVAFDKYGEPYVGFTLDPVGAKIFEDVTAQNSGSRMAIVLDDNVYSAPVIREKISGGSGSISGSFTVDKATDLAVVLKAGSMPAPVTIEENRTVGPSLGSESIEKGVKASVIGLLLICVFMLVYYKLSGLVANIGLICNFIILLGALCALGATLTLPGIAGVILTLGMAVDANVLIFERVREELRHGRTVLNAFEIGYKKAFATIVDANVTSLIAAIVLFQFGTGPVKGFAVTLSLGLIASMFTAVFITKTIFMEFIIRKNVKRISI